MIFYLLKATISLALLLGCYHLFFQKDKWFLFNRFYLLGSIIFSLLIPLAALPDLFQATYFDDSHLQFTAKALEFPAVTENTGASSSVQSSEFSLAYLLYLVYGIGVLGMTFRFTKNLWAMYRLLANAEHHTNGETLLRLVKEPIAPFSFGRYVVANQDEYLQGGIPQDIIRHESLHVRHRHTLDILFMELVLIFGWFHPLLWAYRRALVANHEFCADNYVISQTSEASAYSHTLLDFMHHRSYPHLGSGFHYSLTKHRIIMMQRTVSSPVAFASKLGFTALAAVGLFVMTAFTAQLNQSTYYPDGSVFTVVIDAGHGGADAGTTNGQLEEKDVVLAIAQAMDELVSTSSVRLIYTREGDNAISLADRVEVANQSNADLFLSLHINQHDDEAQQGLEAYYSTQNAQSDLSEKYSQQFIQNITLTKAGKSAVKQADFLVLKNTPCPSVLLNLGFLSNPQESAFLESEKNQRRLASQIVQTINEIQEK
ncbi:M56/M15 family metallopeptidase [Tunicatimonas pelagia]|uniref:M56/M15 family metallopeptidase n=1 Tax=Tunicatimonas pelagia TaxID=931531 RepID=UPI002666074D|nr:M56/M15 family metallopeptidase [Tunicatimonas pelagia]WKN45140.1 M56/M15 family metallopeptidase [Tunicatimonas pelagia]